MIRTHPGPGSGTGSTRTSSLSGGPGSDRTTALMVCSTRTSLDTSPPKAILTPLPPPARAGERVRPRPRAVESHRPVHGCQVSRRSCSGAVPGRILGTGGAGQGTE
ncbi:hypothetical protein GCM10010387_49450 [Streptomyces inusitatus]|uniref:Uncharacterized protein n=1 Tax=Streptomyces inusitatus TaxID=68221 RepID=A0A918QJM8_9ACTN|nr:hypothetical protein GCM10010387_49450 [Streptomyces inusitatus]